MLTKKLFIALATAGLASLTASQGWAVTATTSTTSTTTTATSTVSSPGAASELLVTRYSKLAGSTANSQSLITGLRNGTLVTLAPSATAPAGTPVVSFTPATQNMGFGNIKIALSLAKTTLAKQGITDPTPAQLAAALNGGNVTLANGTVVTLAGVLTQRAAGMGWGKIAQTSGATVGSALGASKTDDARKEDKKIALVKARDSVKDSAKDSDKDDNAKNRSAAGDDNTSHMKGSSSSSSSSASSASSGNSSGGGGQSSNGGGSKSNSGGGNGGGNSGGSGGSNGGGNGGGGGKK